MTKFLKEGPDKKGKISIIEGVEKANKVFSIKRFICEVAEQETEKETQAVADMIISALNSK